MTLVTMLATVAVNHGLKDEVLIIIDEVVEMSGQNGQRHDEVKILQDDEQ
jgi:hypothetical protein